MSAGAVGIQFQDMRQQTHAAEFGMWVFLASEALFFSGLFALYFAYRFEYGDAFRQAANHTDLGLGTADALILLTSSWLVALAIHAVRSRWTRAATNWLLAGAIALAVLFLLLKMKEYLHHISEGFLPGPYYTNAALPGRGAHIFFTLYYGMTGLHAIHMLGGIILLLWTMTLVHRGKVDAGYYTPLELCGMYWSFVDVIWVFLWPMFYLMRA